MCPEIAKTSLIDLALASSIAELYCFGGFGAAGKFFKQKSNLNMQFGCKAQQLMHYSGYTELYNELRIRVAASDASSSALPKTEGKV